MAKTSSVLNADAVPVYLSFTTFRSAVQSLRAHGLPNRLDRTAWQSRSGGEQSQIISAFKFLGLIDENEQPQPSLRKLVDAQEDSEDEKQVLSDLLHERYAKLFELNLKTATPGQLSEAVGSYGPTGATRHRAERFFLKAAQHCGIPLSSRLTSGMRSRLTSGSSDPEANGSAQIPSTAARPRRRRRGAGVENSEEHQEKLSGNTAVKTITLRQVPGTLTLSGTFNTFDLDGEERKLVFDIIDLMKQYEQKKQTASE